METSWITNLQNFNVQGMGQVVLAALLGGLIGMAVGVKAYTLAVFTAVFVFFVLRFLRPVSQTVGPHPKAPKK